MESLQAQLQQNASAQTLNLEFKSINQLESLLPLLSQFHNLQELLLHGNQISTLPNDLSVLNNLVVLDLSNNPLDDIESALNGLSTLSNLNTLMINLQTQEQQQMIIKTLPWLVNLNGVQIVQQNQTYDDSQGNDQSKQYAIKQEDFEQVANIYDQLRELYQETDPTQDAQLADQMDTHLQNIMNSLNNQLNQNKDIPQNVQNCEIVKGKYSLYQICFEKLGHFLSGADPRIGQILQDLYNIHSHIINDLTDIIETSSKDSQNNANQTQDSRAAQQFSKENQVLKQNNTYLQQELDSMRQELESTKQENKQYLDMIIKYSKGDKTQDITNNNSQYQQSSSPQLRQTNTVNQSSFDYDKQRQTVKSSASKTNLNETIQTSAVTRNLSLKQVKDLMEEIYASKTKYDNHHVEQHLPRETMEQHMYSFLNKKYGLKNLVIEWVSAIVNGIKNYSSEDNDIAVFGKILRNECDEEFRFVQNQVKNSIQELIKMYLRGKYPFKNNSDIQKQIKQKTQGKILMEECVEIIKYMYDEDISNQILEKLENLAYNSKKNTAEQRKMTREQMNQSKAQEKQSKQSIDYTLFQKVLLDHQLRSHENFLKPFMQYFRQVDKDINGVIDEQEFRALLGFLNVEKSNDEVTKYLEIVDPSNNNSITFSQCVTLFSQPDPNYQVSIIQKISQEQQAF